MRSGRTGHRSAAPRYPIPAHRFREARLTVGLGVDACASLLRVTDRTVRNWEAGATRIPYAAFKLMRVLKGGKFLGADWKDWHVQRGVLYSPEGHRFEASMMTWWSLLIRQAREFQRIMRERRTQEAAGQLAAGGLVVEVPIDALVDPALLPRAIALQRPFSVRVDTGLDAGVASLLSSCSAPHGNPASTRSSRTEASFAGRVTQAGMLADFGAQCLDFKADSTESLSLTLPDTKESMSENSAQAVLS
jgi:hypothetical protein